MTDDPASAAAIANEFLELAESDTDTTQISPMKLQKLIYYAHAWHLAIKDKPLIEENIEAWSWGPVVRSIYLDFKKFGRHPIENDRATHLRMEGDDPNNMELVEETPSLEDEEKKKFVDLIWRVHKKYTGVQLSNSTHGKGEPWTIIKEKYGDLEDEPIIPNDLIRAVFKAKMK